MNVLICAGGTGPRVIESLIYMACAGVGPDDVSILLIDADQANGNTNRMVSLFENYFAVKDLFQHTGYFNTKFSFLDPAGVQSTQPKIYSPIRDNEKLRDIIGYDGLDATNTPPELSDLFFTRDSELDLSLTEGFRGHPAIGAAALSLSQRFDESKLWKQLIAEIGVAAQNQNRPVKIFLVGSVFGGTGASTFEPLSRYLSNRLGHLIENQRVDIGGLFMTPYFQYVTTDDQGVRTRADRFAIATRAAVEFYQHLRLNNELKFSAMYWIGDRDLMNVAPCDGGPDQENPPHPVELLAAMTILHFFQNQNVLNKVCLYTAPLQTGIHDDLLYSNPFSWEDMPFPKEKRDKFRTAFLSLYAFSIVHNYFYLPLFKSSELQSTPHYLPWLVDHQLETLTSTQSIEKMESVSYFFEKVFYNWVKGVQEKKNCRFFNVFPLNYISQPDIVYYCSNLDWQPPNSAGRKNEELSHIIVEKMCVSKNRAGEGIQRYFNLLKEAVEGVIYAR